MEIVRALQTVMSVLAFLTSWSWTGGAWALWLFVNFPYLVTLSSIIAYLFPSAFSSAWLVVRFLAWEWFAGSPAYPSLQPIIIHDTPVNPENFVDPVVNTMLWFLSGFCIALLVIVVVLLRRKPVIVKRRLVSDAEFYVERMVDGSAFFNTTMPAFQANVYILKDGTWWFSGSCFRTSHGIMTCWHVIAGAERVRIERDGRKLELDPEEFEHLSNLGDVALASVRVEWLKQAKIAGTALMPNDRVMVMVHNGKMASMGPLAAYDAFGMVKYTGSTAKGFSGSPYYMGNIVYGIHFGAAAVNLGYEASYLDLAVRRESSDDYYLELIKAGTAHAVKRSAYDPDEMFVKIRGRYVVMSQEEYYGAAGNVEIENALPYVLSERPEVDVITDPDRDQLMNSQETSHHYTFQDSENYERPAAGTSTAGLSYVKEPLVRATAVQTSCGPASRGPLNGTQSRTELPEPTRAPPKPASNTTYGLTRESAVLTEMRRQALLLNKQIEAEKRRLNLPRVNNKRHKPSSPTTT